MSKTEIEVKLKVPKEIIGYLEAMGQNLKEYCVHAIVESVYMDLGNTPKSDRIAKRYDLARVFENDSLDSEGLPGEGK